jgi:hypothetical protein
LERIGNAKLPPTDFRPDLCHDARKTKSSTSSGIGTGMSGQSDERDKQLSTKTATKEARDRDAELAMQEYQDERVAMAGALRLARDASTVSTAKSGKPKPKK